MCIYIHTYIHTIRLTATARGKLCRRNHHIVIINIIYFVICSTINNNILPRRRRRKRNNILVARGAICRQLCNSCTRGPAACYCFPGAHATDVVDADGRDNDIIIIVVACVRGVYVDFSLPFGGDHPLLTNADIVETVWLKNMPTHIIYPWYR